MPTTINAIKENVRVLEKCLEEIDRCNQKAEMNDLEIYKSVLVDELIELLEKL